MMEQTIQLSNIVTLFSMGIALLSVIYTIKNSKRSDKQDNESRIVETTTMNIKLDAIQKDVQEIKDEIRLQRAELQGLSERMAKVEASTKRAHERLDEHIIAFHQTGK